MEIIQNILRTEAKRKVVSEKPTVIRTEVLDVLVVRLDPEELAGSVLTLETGSVQLPDSAGMRETLIGVGGFVDIEVMLYDAIIELFIVTYD